MSILMPFCFKRLGGMDNDYEKWSGWEIVRKIWNEDRMPNKDDDCMYKWVFRCFPSTLFRLYSILICLRMAGTIYQMNRPGVACPRVNLGTFATEAAD